MKIARRNVNNPKNVADINLLAENKEELKSLLIKVREVSAKVGLSSTFTKLRSWHLVALLHGK